MCARSILTSQKDTVSTLLIASSVEQTYKWNAEAII